MTHRLIESYERVWLSNLHQALVPDSKPDRAQLRATSVRGEGCCSGRFDIIDIDKERFALCDRPDQRLKQGVVKNWQDMSAMYAESVTVQAYQDLHSS